jgi:hypothetical protein
VRTGLEFVNGGILFMKATGIARRCKVHNAIKNKEQITSKTRNKLYQKK